MTRQAHRYVVLAKIRMGELLANTELNKGTKGQLKGRSSGGHRMAPPDLGISKRESSEDKKGCSSKAQPFDTPTLADLGISRTQSHPLAANNSVHDSDGGSAP